MGIVPGGDATVWATGHHAAACVVAGVELGMTTDVLLGDCEDAGGPVEGSLSARFWAELAPAIGSGDAVVVDYWFALDENAVEFKWYTLRRASDGELLLAGFQDPGPDLTAKVEGEPPVLQWMSPFTGYLGDLVCPPADGGCEEDDTPQRGNLDLERGGASYEVLSNTERSLDEYRIYLGFAGRPDICDGVQPPALRGVLYLPE